MTGLRRPLAAGALTALVLVGAIIAAAVPSGVATAALLAASLVPELWGLDHDRLAVRGRRALGVGEATTAGVRGLALELLAARTAATAQVCGAAAVAVLAVGAAAAAAALAALVVHLRRPPVLTRNVDLAVDAPALPALADPLRVVARLAPAVAAVGFAVAATGAATTSALAVAAALTVTPVGYLAVAAARLRAAETRSRVSAAAADAFAALRPELLLYFAASRGELYQLDMWVAAVEQAGVTAAVVVRDHDVLTGLGPTTLPVFSVRHNGTVASLPLPDPTVALFVTHSGNNLALLRRREVRSVFVGHGDSDKPDSMNPFARAYDEVWVAGPAGRNRYLAADVGVHTGAVVEVGRPQLPASWPDPPDPVTVLYAPTWEGWGDDPHHTSLPHAGPALVRRLLDAGVRVVYRPHPLTGVRSETVRRAHAEVVAMLRTAGAVRPDRDVGTAAARRGGDALDVAVATGRRPGPSRAGCDEEGARAADTFFASAGGRPVLLDRDPPTLHQTFRAAHVLVADVSSVASDWLATGRPYVMVDTRGIGAAAFRRQFPVAAAATVVGTDLAGLDALWQEPAPAGAAATVEVTRAQVLGPADAPAAFRAALRALLAAAPRRPAPTGGA